MQPPSPKKKKVNITFHKYRLIAFCHNADRSSYQQQSIAYRNYRPLCGTPISSFQSKTKGNAEQNSAVCLNMLTLINCLVFNQRCWCKSIHIFNKVSRHFPVIELT